MWSTQISPEQHAPLRTVSRISGRRAELAIHRKGQIGELRRARSFARGSRAAVRVIAAAAQEGPRKNLAVLVSGGGSNFRKIQEAIDGGGIDGEVVLVISEKETCGGMEYARSRGIDTANWSGPDVARDILGVLRQKEVDFILLAGFIKLLPREICDEYPQSILNIHPSLLPCFGGKGFYGKRVHQAVLHSGVRFTGATVHFVDLNYDTGPIVAQAVVPVYPESDSVDDIAKRVLKEEHKLYPRVVKALCNGDIRWTATGLPYIFEEASSLSGVGSTEL